MRKNKTINFIIGATIIINVTVFSVFATEQIKDKIIYKGKTHTIEEYPLNTYSKLPDFYLLSQEEGGTIVVLLIGKAMKQNGK